MIQLYCADIRTLPQDTERILQYIAGDRRKQAELYLQEEDKRRSVAASLLLSYAFDKNVNEEWQFSYNEYKKPFLQNEKCFNLSHSGDFVLLATGDNELGVDIEQHKEYNYERLAEVSFSEEEQIYLKNSQEKEVDFFKLWTLKESFMKAYGTGFYLPSKSFHFAFSQEGVITLHAEISNTYTFTMLECIPQYTIAVCGKEPLNKRAAFLDLSMFLQGGTKG